MSGVSGSDLSALPLGSLSTRSGYVIVAWIWSAIWYVLLDPIKWMLCWVLNEDGFRDKKAWQKETKRTLERSSKEQMGEVYNGPGGMAPANYQNPLGRASMSKPVTAVLDRKSAAIVAINRNSMVGVFFLLWMWLGVGGLFEGGPGSNSLFRGRC